MPESALRHLRERHDRLRPDFEELLRIPTVSTDPDHAADVRRGAAWVRDAMEEAGLETSVEETEGHPVVVGRSDRAGPDAPTVLVYAHYDVQPPDPVDAWTSPPFDPTVRDGVLYGRGAADDKAQVVLQIAAAAASLAGPHPPVNLRLVFEGEEEVGSPNLTRLLRRRAEEWSADHVVIADSMMFAPDRPSLIFGMRGMTYLEIEVRAGGRDLHSGQYGGAVPNPVHALAGLLASLHDEEGRVAVPGFYDDVVTPSPELRAEWRALEWDEAAFRASTGGARLSGEPGWSTLERLWIRPCLDVNGVVGGYTGPGKKTVLPGRATAKVSARLVPDQDPDAVARRIADHVWSRAPAGVRVDVRALQSNPPWRADPTGALYDAAGRALEATFGVAPARVCHGGTLPIARAFADVLTPSVVVLGFALPGANMHAPDEWIPLRQLERGAEAMVRLYADLGGGSPGGGARPDPEADGTDA